MVYKYDDIRECMLQCGCELLTTKGEYELMDIGSIPKLKYIASCGHEHSVHYNVFKSRKTGIKCPKCVSKISADKRRGDASRTKDGASLTHSYEDTAVDYICKITQEHFEIRKTAEACLSDLAIRPKNVTEDKWIMIQVKSMAKPCMTYGFNMNQRYKDCLIFCMCLSDQHMWFFNGNEIKVTQKISIGIHNSKYDVNEITVDSIDESIYSFYSILPKFSFDVINTPLNENGKLEQKYRKMREHKCSFLEFKYPNNYLVYDFTVNTHRIQEKVGTYHRNGKSVSFHLYKRDGLSPSGSKLAQNYLLVDNDFYWLNIPNKQQFYVLPAKVLLKYKYISETYTKGQKCLSIDTTNIKFELDYLFDYENLNVDKLLQLLK